LKLDRDIGGMSCNVTVSVHWHSTQWNWCQLW